MTPCSRAVLEKPTVTQLFDKFLAFYGARKFISVVTTACLIHIQCGNNSYPML